MPGTGTPNQRRAPHGAGTRAAAVVSVLALIAGLAGCTAEKKTESTALTTESIQAEAAGLPDDPVQVAEQLVRRIHEADSARARSATAELLRRSGFTIVAGDGQILARPDRLALIDAQIYVELIPALTRATHDGYLYRVDQLAEMLHGVGSTSEKVPFAALTDGIAGWGKRPAVDPVFPLTATAVRALSSHRGQVLYRGADPETTYLDALQYILLLGHGTSRYGIVKGAPSHGGPNALGIVDRLLGTGVAHADEPGGCAKLDEMYDGMSKEEQLALDLYLKDHDRRHGGNSGKAVSGALDGYGKATTLINGAMLFLGARLELTADKASTHFKHTVGSRAEHVQLTATATWDPQVAATHLECYSLAGLDLPEPGPLKDFRIWWNDHQPKMAANGMQKYLIPAKADSKKTIDGSRTDAEGKTTLEIKPPVEQPAGTGRELKGSAYFVAKLDKENFPFDLTDILSVSTGGGLGKAYDLVIELLTKASLPSRTIRVDVTYHGSEVVVARGKGSASFPGMVAINGIAVDLVSCDGSKGPYKGTAGHGRIDAGAFLQLQSEVTGIDLPGHVGGQETRVELTLPEVPGSATTTGAKGEGGRDLLTVKLDIAKDEKFWSPSYIYIPSREQIGRPIGEMEMLVAGSSWFFGGLTWPVYRVAEDPRCDATEYSYDEA